MKKGIILALSVLVFGFISCGKSDENQNSKSIIGTWIIESVRIGDDILPVSGSGTCFEKTNAVFTEKTASITFYEGESKTNCTEEKLSGEYKLQGNEILATLESGKTETIGTFENGKIIVTAPSLLGIQPGIIHTLGYSIILKKI